MKVANNTCSTQSSASSNAKNKKEYRIEKFNNFKILGLIDEGPYIKNFITQRTNDAAIFVKGSGYNVSNIVGHIFILKQEYMSADTSTFYYRCQNCLSLENKDRSNEDRSLKTGATAQIKMSSFIKNKDHIDKCKSIPLNDAIVKHTYQYFLKESESFVGVPIDEYDRFIYKITAICRKLEIPTIEFFKNRNWVTTSQCLKAFRQHKYNYIDKLVASNGDSNDVFDLENKSFILFEDENKEYVVFGSEENLRRLSSSKLWISDGTFRAAPKGCINCLKLEDNLKNMVSVMTILII